MTGPEAAAEGPGGGGAEAGARFGAAEAGTVPVGPGEQRMGPEEAAAGAPGAGTEAGAVLRSSASRKWRRR